MKKSADAYSRSFQSKTGTLDCTKLHTYKFNEDLFKKVNVIPDGKNHGLIFILDWSGSMGSVIEDTIKQLYNLIWFCSKVNIPFEVYAFTNHWGYGSDLDDSLPNDLVEGTFFISRQFFLMNIISSKVNRGELEDQMKHIFRIAKYHNYSGASYTCPPKLSLSGTPLYESVIALHKIIPQFKQQHKLQKVQCVILTDGEGHPLASNFVGPRYSWEKSTTKDAVIPSYYREVIYRNRKTGYTYKLRPDYKAYNTALMDDLSKTFPDTNVIGFRICSTREMNSYINEYETPTEQEWKKIKKDKSYRINKAGYDALFVMASNSLNNSTEFEVDEGATKAKIKSAFSKSLKAKALNKKLLSQFMEMVS